MKKIFIAFLTTCMLIVPATLASASEVKMDNTMIVSTSNMGVHTEYRPLKVGYSMFLVGDSMQVVSGGDCVTTFGMRVTAQKPGNVVINLYKGGVLIGIEHLNIVYEY